MSHGFLTFIKKIDQSKRETIEQCLDELGNPAEKSLRHALRPTEIIHFMSSSLVHGDDGKTDYWVLEMSVDGNLDEACALFDDTETGLSQLFDPLFTAMGLNHKAKAKTLKSFHVTTGHGYFDLPGLSFSGSPGMSIGRIRKEYILSRAIRNHFDNSPVSGSALEIVTQLRASVHNPGFFSEWEDENIDPDELLKIEPTPLLQGEVSPPGRPGLLLNLLGSFAASFLWPLLIIAIIASVLLLPAQNNILGWVWGFTWRFAAWFAGLAFVSIAGFLLLLTRREQQEQDDRSLPDAARLSEVRRREDGPYVQNHLFGVSRMKPGLIRKIAIRLTFWIIGQLATKSYRPGYLANIGTIHFARWFMIPGTDKLIFCSNYGGSWESYLEDFITKASSGLTGVWSNTFGFPPSRFLFFKGATSGEAFKRWARRQQIPTRLWYCAYPYLTTDRIRINAAIRKGLASAATEDEAEAFLSLFASMRKPATDIERDEIQSLMFGGLGRHPLSACILVKLSDDVAQNQEWLASRLPDISFGGAPASDQVHQIAFSASGLKKMDLDRSTCDQFSFPFQEGMSKRTRILKDTGEDKPEKWNWGYGDKAADCAYFIYQGSDKKEPKAADINTETTALKRKVSSFKRHLKKFGGDVTYHIITSHLREGKTKAHSNSEFHREPFGFVDGVSQPIIEGLRRGHPNTGSRLHKVKAGEFILGYPDNRGTETLLPTLPASKDPNNILPVHHPKTSDGAYPDFAYSGVNADRAFGRNGTYLVIRQIKQYPEKLSKFLDKAAGEVAKHPGVPKWYSKEQVKHFIAAKMVGRWKDGTSLVKFPSEPGTGWKEDKDNRPPDNDFLFGQEDPTATSCPYGSHVRRSNPRDSFPPHDQEQLDINNRHRILRRGRFYKDGQSNNNAGLLFVCANADLERQFEFIQQTWCMTPQFMGMENEVDPIIGRGRGMGRLTIPTPNGPIFVKGVPDLVTIKGGEYFFMPSRSALHYLSASQSPVSRREAFKMA